MGLIILRKNGKGITKPQPWFKGISRLEPANLVRQHPWFHLVRLQNSIWFKHPTKHLKTCCLVALSTAAASSNLNWILTTSKSDEHLGSKLPGQAFVRSHCSYVWILSQKIEIWQVYTKHGAILRTIEPILDLFVLIWMQFLCRSQIRQQKSTFWENSKMFKILDLS